jgi:hypothetical protein
MSRTLVSAVIPNLGCARYMADGVRHRREPGMDPILYIC